MLEALFTQLNVGQKFAAHHDEISDKTILRMAIENIRKSGMLDIALRDWALQTTKSSWAEFTLFMYKAQKYRRDTAETTGSAGFPPTSTASHRMMSLIPLAWPPHPHQTSMN